MFSTIFFYYFQHRHIKSTTITKKYNKNIQNDIIGIYDADGNQIVKYVYDAWGNHKTFVLYNGKFVDISLENDYNDDNYQGKVEIAELNPFRYRSYYLDDETGLYYLNSRYYDAELGRFINADSLDNLDKETLNGLNLFAYCLNNPVNLTDSKGTSWWSDLWEKINKALEIVAGIVVSAFLVVAGVLLIVFTTGTLSNIGSALIGAGVGGLVGGIQSSINGGNFWAGWLGGAVTGAITGYFAFTGILGLVISGGMGNFLGSALTDYLNGVDQSGLDYWMNLIGESALAGIINIAGGLFGQNTEVLKALWVDIFAAMSVWSEFAFSALSDWVRDILDNIKNKGISFS